MRQTGVADNSYYVNYYIYPNEYLAPLYLITPVITISAADTCCTNNVGSMAHVQLHDGKAFFCR